MVIKEHGYIRYMLKQNGPVQQPHYADDGYQAGDNVEGGFEVAGKPETPEHIVIHIGPRYTIDNSDMESRFREAAQHEPKEVIRLGSTVTYLPPEEPAYMDPDRGKDARAEAVAQAVKAAIMRGEIDPSIFE